MTDQIRTWKVRRRYFANKTAVDAITGARNVYRNIQPEQDVSGAFGNGWKGVYRWCEMNSDLIPLLFSDIDPCLDLLIIQMDGDVARKEKEVHCLCAGTECEMKGQIRIFGEADYGKTTLVGYLLSRAENLDMDKVEDRLKAKFGSNYDEGLLYSSLISETGLGRGSPGDGGIITRAVLLRLPGRWK